MTKSVDRARIKNELLFALGSGVVTADALAERFRRSPRQIYRIISELKKEGAPIRGEAGVGYMMRAPR